MAEARPERPYAQFNFRVDLADGSDVSSAVAGFQEITGLGTEITVAEYRNGNDKFNSVRKISLMNKASDVTFKRGAIGVLTLYKWIDNLRSGQADYRTVVVHLMAEDHSGPVLTWRMLGARPSKYTAGQLSAKGTDVMMEEMVLVYERLEME